MGLTLQLTDVALSERSAAGHDEPVWVRELAPGEQAGTKAKTGDVLADGSVLLRREDMDRMGLNGLRDWILRRVVQEGATIVIGENALELSAHLLEDEAAS